MLLDVLRVSRRVERSQLEVKVARIVHCLDVALGSTFLIEFDCLVPVSVNAKTKLVADAKIGNSSSVATLGCLCKPTNRLLVVLLLVEE